MTRAPLLAPLALTCALLGPTASDPFPNPDGPPAPQDPVGQDERGKGEQQDDEEEFRRDIFGRQRRVPAGERGPLEGAWQLLDIDSENYPRAGRDAWGYMLVSDGFLALQVHAIWYEDEIKEFLNDSFESLIGEYVFVTSGILQVRTLAGAFLDDVEELDFEAEGTMREFRAQLDGGALTLQWGNGETLTFGRRLPLARTQWGRDVFGRRRTVDRQRGADIFGRERRLSGDREGDEDDDR